MSLVVAIGGNALQRGGALSAASQRERLSETAASLAKIFKDQSGIIVHGNGPQVGLLALESDAYKAVPAYPLDVLGAESQGMIGYMIEEALRRELPDRDIAVLLTQTEVLASDPAFQSPTKPIGPFYPEHEETELIDNLGWTMQRTPSGLRRLVASPKPKGLPAMTTIKSLVEQGTLVICGGGGGVPVAARLDGGFVGVEAVIDKDLTAALIAQKIGADTLIILTNVAGIYANWGAENQHLIKETTPPALSELTFELGSMAPKVEAVAQFCEATGKHARIGSLMEAEAVVSGRAGTLIRTGD